VGRRKRRYLAQLASAGPRAQLVAACDKLHNLRSLVADLKREGASALERFTASPEQTRWYYESAHALLRDALPTAARRVRRVDRGAARLHRARRGAVAEAP
jgi:(p)ppGpp synthase/HD superfamily hydrolase